MDIINNSMKFGDVEISFSINRTERNSIGIIVEPDGKVVIKAPYSLNEEIIKKTIYKKRNWITEKIKLSQEIKKPIPEKRELVSGEKILLKNKLYRLKVHPHQYKNSKIYFAFKFLHIFINENLSLKEREEEIKKLIIDWYKENARNIIKKRLDKYVKYLDYLPEDIKIRDMKQRWGSCTKDRILIFNWRIIMAPISAIDYVIVHELVHLKEPLHSPRFWNNVEVLLPNHQKWKEWLRINGKLLDLRM